MANVFTIRLSFLTAFSILSLDISSFKYQRLPVVAVTKGLSLSIANSFNVLLQLTTNISPSSLNQKQRLSLDALFTFSLRFLSFLISYNVYFSKCSSVRLNKSILYFVK